MSGGRILATLYKEVRVTKCLALCAMGLMLAVCTVFAADPPAKVDAGAENAVAKSPAAAADPDWAMNATIIEACSCPMFCQCYFDTKPAAHADAGDAADPHAGHGAQPAAAA